MKNSKDSKTATVHVAATFYSYQNAMHEGSNFSLRKVAPMKTEHYFKGLQKSHNSTTPICNIFKFTKF